MFFSWGNRSPKGDLAMLNFVWINKLIERTGQDLDNLTQEPLFFLLSHIPQLFFVVLSIWKVTLLLIPVSLNVFIIFFGFWFFFKSHFITALLWREAGLISVGPISHWKCGEFRPLVLNCLKYNHLFPELFITKGPPYRKWI